MPDGVDSGAPGSLVVNVTPHVPVPEETSRCAPVTSPSSSPPCRWTIRRHEAARLLTNAPWWAPTLGADLGGNATAVGASADVVVIGIAARNGHPLSFWQFTKYGLVVAVVTIASAWPHLYRGFYAFT